jgi:hypothetical protein
VPKGVPKLASRDKIAVDQFEYFLGVLFAERTLKIAELNEYD